MSEHLFDFKQISSPSDHFAASQVEGVWPILTGEVSSVEQMILKGRGEMEMSKPEREC